MDAKDKRIAELETLLQSAWEEIVTLKARILQLESELAGARKNSSNSSKPPSSDIVKPPKDKPPVDQKTKRKVKRKRGAQKGYKQNLRKPLAPELIDEIVKLELSHCPDCGKTRNIFPISTAKSGDWKEKETNNSL